MLTCDTWTGTVDDFLFFPSGHIVVTNFPLCALSVLWLSVEFCDRFHGSSKIIVRVHPSFAVHSVFFLHVPVVCHSHCPSSCPCPCLSRPSRPCSCLFSTRTHCSQHQSASELNVHFQWTHPLLTVK